MNISQNELIAILAKFNPWWGMEAIPDLPQWKRAAFHELFSWVFTPPAPRAVLLSGARQVGKTTLIMQVIKKLLEDGVPAGNILYATFDHPIIKLAGIDAVLEAWRAREPKSSGEQEYLFLDEAQFIRDWGTWVKHQVDFNKSRRITFTGSAMPLLHDKQESGVGRWHTIRLTTLSFFEYIQLKKLTLPKLRSPNSLEEIFSWAEKDFLEISEMGTPYVGHFHEYLIRGGFPQTALVESINQAQRLLREDIIDKVLKRDMTALFGVRRILELEQTFLYLCMHDGGILSMPDLCENLSVKRPTAQHFIDLLEATHLIYRLLPFGYGKDVLRGKFKIYMADAAIAPAVLLKGKSILDDPAALGIATETAVFKHLYARSYPHNIRFTYWKGNKDIEVDLVAEMGNQIVPFEVKYRAQHTAANDLKGMQELCKKKPIKQAYVITKSLNDFGPFRIKDLPATNVMHIPAPLMCYWMGKAEVDQIDSSEFKSPW